jgi:hypothetical protein
MRLHSQDVQHFSSAEFGRAVAEPSKLKARLHLPSSETPNKEFLLGVLSGLNTAMAADGFKDAESYANFIHALIYRAARMYLLEVKEKGATAEVKDTVPVKVEVLAPEVRAYHARLQLTSVARELVLHNDTVDAEGQEASPVALLLSALPGVAAVQLMSYTAVIQKAEAYGWDEVQPRVLEILNCQKGLV